MLYILILFEEMFFLDEAVVVLLLKREQFDLFCDFCYGLLDVSDVSLLFCWIGLGICFVFGELYFDFQEISQLFMGDAN